MRDDGVVLLGLHDALAPEAARYGIRQCRSKQRRLVSFPRPPSLFGARMLIVDTRRKPNDDVNHQDRCAAGDAGDAGRRDALREQEGRRGQGRRYLRATESAVRSPHPAPRAPLLY